ncbi:MAG: flagellar basal body-associated FliL family protein [Pseudomonadota bacterium]
MATAPAKSAKTDAVAAPADAVAVAVKAPGKKKLIVILAVVVLLLGAAGGGAVYFMKKKAAAAAAAAEADGGEPAEEAKEAKPTGPPTFVPLEPFVVNLADKGADRYAQIAVTFQIDDPKFAEQLKLYMPAIRNSILMILADKTSDELLDRAGKEALAAEIMEEALRPMHLGSDAGKTGDKVQNPIRKVHFANFIIQ